MIIPIGVDCEITELCKKYNLRSCSLPFDWTVSYNGVSKCIDDEMNHFIPQDNQRINPYDVYFHHDFHSSQTYEEDKTKYDRRVQRLIRILETSSEKITFCRKGHCCHHHNEHNGQYKDITSDIEDAEKLDAVISNKYPDLVYEIHIILVCGKCFDSNANYNCTSKNITIYNIASEKTDSSKIEDCFRTIFHI